MCLCGCLYVGMLDWGGVYMLWCLYVEAPVWRCVCMVSVCKMKCWYGEVLI